MQSDYDFVLEVRCYDSDKCRFNEVECEKEEEEDTFRVPNDYCILCLYCYLTCTTIEVLKDTPELSVCADNEDNIHSGGNLGMSLEIML